MTHDDYRDAERDDELHDRLVDVLGPGPFMVLHIAQRHDVDRVDGLVEASMRTLVHDLSSMQVLSMLTQVTASLVQHMAAAAHREHVVAHFREDLEQLDPATLLDPDGDR